MKTCVNCGTIVEEKDDFCPYCGKQCDYREIESEYHKEIETEHISSDNATKMGTNLYPMKWHSFLMVIMIIKAIITVINGIGTLMGIEYIQNGTDAARVYSTFPDLKICDMCYGIMVIGLGIYRFIVRHQLNQFQENGPSSMKIMYILEITANLVYLNWASSILNVNLFNSANIGSIVGTGILLIINSIYYSKRSALFVN